MPTANTLFVVAKESSMPRRRAVEFTHQTAPMERGRGIEPLALAWKAKVLPLYEPRIILIPCQCYQHDILDQLFWQ